MEDTPGPSGSDEPDPIPGGSYGVLDSERSYTTTAVNTTVHSGAQGGHAYRSGVGGVEGQGEGNRGGEGGRMGVEAEGQQQQQQQQQQQDLDAQAALIKKDKLRVRFNSNAADRRPQTSPPAHPALSSPTGTGSSGSPAPGPGSLGQAIQFTEPPTSPQFPQSPSHQQQQQQLQVPRPRPSVLRTNSGNAIPTITSHLDPDPQSEKAMSAAAAQERAKLVAERVNKQKQKQKQNQDPNQDPAEASRDSIDSNDSHDSHMTGVTNISMGSAASDIPLQSYNHATGEWTTYHQPPEQHQHHHQAGQGNGESSSSKKEIITEEQQQTQGTLHEQAYNLVRSHTRYYAKGGGKEAEAKRNENAIADEESLVKPSEVNDGSWDGVYHLPAPQEYRGSVLSQLLKLYKPVGETVGGHSRNWSSTTLGAFHGAGHEEATSGGSSGGRNPFENSRRSSGSPGSGAATPKRKWYEQNKSQETLSNLMEASMRLANPNMKSAEEKEKERGTGSPGPSSKRWSRPPKHTRRTSSQNRMSQFFQKEESRITMHIAETLSRQDYIIKLCRSLMLYGAPTHRLEEYLSMTARFLQIDGQFLYLPGCMVISFDDRSTHTTEVRIVRTTQGIDLGKLKDVHRVYKEVMHDVMDVEEATEQLDTIMKRKDKFNPWLRVLIFGLTSAVSAPFSFKARLIDLPLLFCFGCLVGFLQLIVSSRSALYSNVFEVSAVVVVSFLARAFGSINGGNLFCFSALAQGGIVMLLPGYLVLSSALELQSRAIVPGSIRIVYAIVYSLLLGFGITVGSAIYGVIDSNATSDIQCQNPIDPYISFAFVPPFVLCISILYQAKWRQMPVMVVIAFAGYIVNFFSSRKFEASRAIANTLGALTVGILANLYSRIRHGVAAATLIPAIFTQVPGGLASTGGLLSGINTANMLTGSGNTTGEASADMPTSETQPDSEVDTVVFNVAASMIQIAIGIAVGLFLSALIIYPLGKRRSGLFSF